MNSSCVGASISDTCLVYCAEGYQAVSNDTSILTCAYNSSDNTAHRENEVPLCLVVTRDVIASLSDFSECFSFTYNETCVVRCSAGHTGVDDKTATEFKGDSDGHLQGSLECRWNCPPSERWPSVFCFATITSSRQTATNFLSGTESLRTT